MSVLDQPKDINTIIQEVDQLMESSISGGIAFEEALREAIKTVDPVFQNSVRDQYVRQYNLKLNESLGKSISDAVDLMKAGADVNSALKSSIQRVPKILQKEVQRRFPLEWAKRHIMPLMQEHLEIDTAGLAEIIRPPESYSLEKAVEELPDSLKLDAKRQYETDRKDRIENAAQRIAEKATEEIQKTNALLPTSFFQDTVERDPGYQGGSLRGEKGVEKDIRLDVGVAVLQFLPDENTRSVYGASLIAHKLNQYLGWAKYKNLVPNKKLSSELLSQALSLIPSKLEGSILALYQNQEKNSIQELQKKIQEAIRKVISKGSIEILKVLDQERKTLVKDMRDPDILDQAIAGLDPNDRIECLASIVQSTLLDEIAKGKPIEDALQGALDQFPADKDVVRKKYEERRSARIAEKIDEVKAMIEMPLAGQTPERCFLDTIGAIRKETASKDLILELLKQIGKDADILQKIGIASEALYKKFIKDKLTIDLESTPTPGPAPMPGPAPIPPGPRPARPPDYLVIDIPGTSDFKIHVQIDGTVIPNLEITPPWFIQQFDAKHRAVAAAQASYIYQILNLQFTLTRSASPPDQTILKVEKLGTDTDIPGTLEEVINKYSTFFPRNFGPLFQQNPSPISPQQLQDWRDHQLPGLTQKITETLWETIRKKVGDEKGRKETIAKINEDPKTKKGLKKLLAELKYKLDELEATELAMTQNPNIPTPPTQDQEENPEGRIEYFDIGKERVLFEDFDDWDIIEKVGEDKVKIDRTDADGWGDTREIPIADLKARNIILKVGDMVCWKNAAGDMEPGYKIKAIAIDAATNQKMVTLEKNGAEVGSFPIQEIRKLHRPFTRGDLVKRRASDADYQYRVVQYDTATGYYQVVEKIVPFSDEERAPQKARLDAVHSQNPIDWKDSKPWPHHENPPAAPSATAQTIRRSLEEEQFEKDLALAKEEAKRIYESRIAAFKKNHDGRDPSPAQKDRLKELILDVANEERSTKKLFEVKNLFDPEPASTPGAGH